MTLKQQQQPNFSLGAAGEQRAAQFLTQQGYKILSSNVSIGPKEIDLVALDPARQEIVFIEVKTRTQNYSGHPSHAANWKKLAALRKAAALYLKEHHLHQDYRFDLITILPNSLDHFENITW